MEGLMLHHWKQQPQRAVITMTKLTRFKDIVGERKEGICVGQLGGLVDEEPKWEY